MQVGTPVRTKPEKAPRMLTPTLLSLRGQSQKNAVRALNMAETASAELATNNITAGRAVEGSYG